MGRWQYFGNKKNSIGFFIFRVLCLTYTFKSVPLDCCFRALRFSLLEFSCLSLTTGACSNGMVSC